jgi:Ran GTPase-activating protein (RanGAP) involved in mRNA processing and transport
MISSSTTPATFCIAYNSEVLDILRTNPALESLVIKYPKFNSISEADDLVNAVNRHEALTSVDLSWGRFSGESCDSILAMKVDSLNLSEIFSQFSINFKNLETNDVLKNLNLSKVFSNIVRIEDLSIALEKNTTLEYLCLQDNNLKDIEALALGQALRKHPTLRKLNLSFNKIEYLGLIGLLYDQKDIETVIEFCTHDQLEELKEVMIQPPIALKTLNIFSRVRSGGIGKMGSLVIAAALSNDKFGLTNINLSGNSFISLKDIKRIFDSLKDNRNLTTLDLTNTNQYPSIARDTLTEEEVNTMFDFLKTNNTLTTLDLSLTRIGSREVIALANALKGNTTLKFLNLDGNTIDTLEGEMAMKKISQITIANKIISLANSLDSIELMGSESYLGGGAGASAGGGTASAADEGRTGASVSAALARSSEPLIMCNSKDFSFLLLENVENVKGIIDIVSSKTEKTPDEVIKLIEIFISREKSIARDFAKSRIDQLLQEVKTPRVETTAHEAFRFTGSITRE